MTIKALLNREGWTFSLHGQRAVAGFAQTPVLSGDRLNRAISARLAAKERSRQRWAAQDAEWQAHCA